MISLGQHLDDRQKRGSVIHPASVVANRPDGDVDVTIRQTQKQVRASRGNTPGTYTAGQLVQVSRTDASGVTSNTGWVIIGPAPSTMRGSSKSSPLTDTSRRSAAVVIRIDPNPVVINVGKVVTVTLRGVFPEGTVVSYGSEDLSDDVAPVVTPSQITLHVKAADHASDGERDLLLDGTVVAPGLFHVISVPEHSLWALVYDADDNGSILRINLADMSVFRRYDTGISGVTYITRKGSAVYAKLGGEGSTPGEFFRVSLPDGAALSPVPCTPSKTGSSSHSLDGLRFADVGTLLYYGDNTGWPAIRLVTFDSSTGAEVSWPLSFSGGEHVENTAIDFGGHFIFIHHSGGVLKWDIAASAEVAAMTDTISGVAADDVSVFIARVVSGGHGYIERRDLETFSHQSQSATMDQLQSVAMMQVVAAYLYVSGSHTSGASPRSHFFAKFDRTSMALLASVAIPETPHALSGFAYADGIFYIGDNDGGISRIDAASMTLIDRTVFASTDGILGLVHI